MHISKEKRWKLIRGKSEATSFKVKSIGVRIAEYLVWSTHPGYTRRGINFHETYMNDRASTGSLEEGAEHLSEGHRHGRELDTFF